MCIFCWPAGRSVITLDEYVVRMLLRKGIFGIIKSACFSHSFKACTFLNATLFDILYIPFFFPPKLKWMNFCWPLSHACRKTYYWLYNLAQIMLLLYHKNNNNNNNNNNKNKNKECEVVPRLNTFIAQFCIKKRSQRRLSGEPSHIALPLHHSLSMRCLPDTHTQKHLRSL